MKLLIYHPELNLLIENTFYRIAFKLFSHFYRHKVIKYIMYFDGPQNVPDVCWFLLIKFRLLAF